ncbi:MAG: hypothetical protein NXH78_13570 [Hyphomonadaceae bacterium]|nr:hypothetical protein [Hyphomonadaceae bacterium]
MTDWYGKGRWGTGDRPLSSGPEQSAYDSGAQQRRFEEERRRREDREQAERARKQQEEWRRKDREGAERLTSRSGETSSNHDNDEDEDWDLDGILILASIGTLTFFLIKLWGMATAGLAPSNDILAAIVNHGAWGVGLIGIGLGIRFQELLLPIAKIAAVALILFFGSAIVVGIYRGISG